MIPIVACSPELPGLARASTRWPTLTSPGSAGCTAGRPVAWTRRSARSVSGSRPTRAALCRVPSPSSTARFSSRSTPCEVVAIRPADHRPAPAGRVPGLPSPSCWERGRGVRAKTECPWSSSGGVCRSEVEFFTVISPPYRPEESSMEVQAFVIDAQLRELALNLRWTWDRETRALFRDIYPTLWDQTEDNPWLMLRTTSMKQLAAHCRDSDFCARLERIYTELQRYMAERGWFHQDHPEEG